MFKKMNFEKVLNIAYVFLLFFALNVIGFIWFKYIAFDVTDEGRFSVSGHIKQLVQKIPERIDVHVYISEIILTDMPAMENYAQRIQDYLNTLMRESNGKLTVTHHIIESFSEQEDEAVAMGLKQIPFKDGRSVFFGIVAENMLDGEGIIPFVNPEREDFVEYDLARLIQGLVKTKRTKVAITSSLPLETGFGGKTGLLSGTSKPYYIYQALSQNYDLIGLSHDYHELLDPKSRPELAMILHPKSLTGQAKDNLSQYFNSGGRVLLAFDPYSEVPSLPIGSPEENPVLFSDVSEFLKPYGLSVNQGVIILDKKHARRMINPKTSKPEAYLSWLKFVSENLNQTHPVVSSLRELSFSTVGSLVKDKDYKGKLEITPLIFSLDKAGFITRQTLLEISDISALGRDYKPQHPYMVSAMVSGKNEQGQMLGLIAIADTDFLDDRLWLQSINDNKDVVPYAENMNFILNSVDYLTGDDALLVIRGQKVPQRPLAYLNNIREEAQAKYLEQEQELQKKIETLRKRIRTLNLGFNQGTQPLPSSINAEIQKLSYDIVELRHQLRLVRRDMSLNIKNAEKNIKLINIIITPLMFAAFAVVILVLRKKKFLFKRIGD